MNKMLTGDRPTGKLHLGHYVGTLKNRVKYQHDYDSYFIIADLHMLTTKNLPEHINQTDANAKQLVLDAISAGIDPDKVTFYLQSGVHEIHEIYTLLQNLVTTSRLSRIPSLKEMAQDSNIEMPFGLLGYPVLQTADILSVKANYVPVGKDNLAHIEVTREIARRFNSTYGELFPIPKSEVGEVPTLIGIDGKKKMSKSLNNAIYLSDTPKEVAKKVNKMYTDPNRISSDIPGRVENNPVFIYHDAFNKNNEEVEDLKARYKLGKVGDFEVKEKLTKAINEMLEPMHERRSLYANDHGYIEEVILKGTEKVRKETQNTLYSMRKLMGFSGAFNRIRRKAEKRQKKQRNN